MTCFPGWTWEYIDDHMTIPRMTAINKYQSSHPPIHVMIAAYLGIKTDASSSEGGSFGVAEGYNEDGQSLFDLFPSGA